MKIALSVRQQDVLNLLAQGFPDRKIAERLGISPKTVSVHLRFIYGKLEVHSRLQAVVKASKMGIVNFDFLKRRAA